MNETHLNEEKFLKLPPSKIARIVKQKGKPKTGIFVPDGSRKMTMALSNLSPDSDEFYSEYARLTTKYFMNNLKVFFTHGLETLFVPLISTAVFNRNKQFRQISLQEGLNAIFQSKTWLKFYAEHDIKINVYGDLHSLAKNGFRSVIEMIEAAKKATAGHKTHRLFLGFAAPERIGSELMHLAIGFYKQHGREPTYEERVRMHYGEYVPPADFFIMSTKFAGLGALPPLLTGKETQIYFLAAPGVFSLTQDTYRKILYDLLFLRPNGLSKGHTADDLQDIEALKLFYSQQKSTVLGLGKKIGNFWVPRV